MKIKINMKEFTDLEEAFSYFYQNIYPNLERGKASEIKSIMYYYTSGVRGVSDKKKVEILENYANAKVEKTFKIFL